MFLWIKYPLQDQVDLFIDPVLIVNALQLDLVFVAYPVAVLLMPFPNFWAVLFFLSLIFLGIDSQVIILKDFTTYIYNIYI